MTIRTVHGDLDQTIDHYLREYAPDRAPASITELPSETSPSEPAPTPDRLSLSANRVRTLALRSGCYVEASGSLVPLFDRDSDSDPNILDLNAPQDDSIVCL